MRIASNTFGFTVLIGFLAALPALSIDISAPTLVDLQTDLGTTTTVAGLTLSMFMVGFALGQAAGGILSDRHGRRPLLLSGLVAYAAAAVGCALSPSGTALVVFRFVQGLGAGTCAVLAFAIVEDLFEGDSRAMLLGASGPTSPSCSASPRSSPRRLGPCWPTGLAGGRFMRFLRSQG